MFKRGLKLESKGREAAMATSTFDRKLILEDDSAIERFLHIVNTEPSGRQGDSIYFSCVCKCSSTRRAN